MDQGEDGGVRLDWSRSVNRKRKETTCGRTSAMRNKNVLASRVKRVMQGDEDVGKIAHASPVLIGACTCLTKGGRRSRRTRTWTFLVRARHSSTWRTADSIVGSD